MREKYSIPPSSNQKAAQNRGTPSCLPGIRLTAVTVLQAVPVYRYVKLGGGLEHIGALVRGTTVAWYPVYLSVELPGPC